MEKLTGVQRFLIAAVVFVGMFIAAYIIEVAGLRGWLKLLLLVLAGGVFSTIGYFLSKTLSQKNN